MTEKGLKVNVKKTKFFCAGKKTVAMEASFHALYVEEKWGETPFYASSVIVWCIKMP